MRWKWILGVIVVLIVAFVATFYAIVTSYDFNKLKPKIARTVKDATGREFTLAGNMELKVSLTPALVVEDVSFQNAPWGTRSELAKVGRLEVQVAVLPLISGLIEVKRLILVEPDILIETNDSGKSNVEFETANGVATVEPKEKVSSEDELTVPDMVFSKVLIEKGRLTYKDGQSGKTYEATLDRVAAAAGKDSPIEVELKGTYENRHFDVSATLGQLTALADPDRVSPVKLTVRAVGTAVTIDGAIRDAPKAKGLDLNVRAQGRSVPDLVKLFNVPGVPDVGPFKVSGKLTDPAGKLTVKNLNVMAGTKDLAMVKLTGLVEDLLTLRGIELGFDIQGKDLANLEKVSGRPLPFTGAFNFSGHAALPAAKTWKLSDLKLCLEKSDLSGSAEINLTDKQPKVVAVLSSQKLDVRPFLSTEEAKAGTSTRQSANTETDHVKVFPDKPLPLDPLKQAQVDLKIRAEHVLVPGLALDDITAHMVLEDGCLTVQPIQFTTAGGTLDGRFAMCPHGKAAALAVELKINQLDLGGMLNTLGVKGIMEGKIDMDIDLKGKGSSVAGVMAELNGQTVLIMSDGSINNRFLKLLGADLSSSLFRLVNPFKRETQLTEINCLVSGLEIKGGIAQTTVLLLDTSHVSVVGHGKVDLKTEELDLSLKPSPKKGLGIKGLAKLSLSLGELTKPLKLSGKLTNPRLAIDPSRTLLTIGKAVGGVALLGPVGIAAALASGKLGDKNPCLAAIAAAKNGDTIPGEQQSEGKNGVIDKAAGAVSSASNGHD